MLFCLGDSFERNELISLFQQNNVKFVIGGHIHDRPESINLGTFSQEVISSFTYENAFALLKVNEEKQTTQFTLKTLN
jgi:UDP-2,3-diacylglucosamine pyrophosphatase LpxH